MSAVPPGQASLPLPPPPREKPPPPHRRARRLVARLLTIIGVVLLVVSLLANFVKKEALDKAQFRDTSRQLIADEAVRDELSSTLVNQLYANVDVSGALAKKLPKNLKGLAGPIAGAVNQVADTTARRLLEQPRTQALFVTAASQAQQEFVAVLNGKTRSLSTTNGEVILDVRPLVLALGSRFSFVPDLQDAIPPSAGKITILRSDQLDAAQRGTRLLRFVAGWIWVLVILAWAGAIWLARGRRRIEVRAIAVGLVISGFLVLITRTLLGRYVVDHLVVSDSVKPAASSAYDILTRLLAGAGWTNVIVGLIALFGTWLSGPGRRAHSTRHALAPYLRRPEIAYGALIVAYLVLLWWKPTPQFGFLLDIAVLFVFALLGLEALRRLTAREFPDAQPGDPAAAIRRAIASLRRPHSEVTVAGGLGAELERLGRLRDNGILDEDEFRAAKARLIAGGG